MLPLIPLYFCSLILDTINVVITESIIRPVNINVDVIDDVDNRGYTIFDKEKINSFYEIYKCLKNNCNK